MTTTSNPSGAHTATGDTSYASENVQPRGAAYGDHDIKESKPGFKTSEFIVWIVASALVLIAGAVVDNGEGEGAFGIYRAFQIFGWLSVAYIVSRGLAKIGVRHQDR